MAFNGIIWLMTVEIRMKIKNRSQGWSEPRHEHKYTKYKMSQIMMAILTKQHLRNIWSSIHQKVKKQWGWVEKSNTYKKSV